jgi:sulfatase modifying factor 1
LSSGRPLLPALILLFALLVVALLTTRVPPDSPAFLYTAGRAALATRQWDVACARFEALAALDPGYRDATDRLNQTRYRAGVAYLETGEYARAVAQLRQVIAVYEGAEDKLAQALDHSVACVPAGEFLIGSDTGDVDERPQRRIHLDAFEIDVYEVTNVQYARFLQTTGRAAPQHWPGRYVHLIPDQVPEWRGTSHPVGEATHPVVAVTWQDAVDYCAWAGKRLPTEAEWEKAARGTDGRIYPWGDVWNPGNANTRAAGVGYPQAVGTYPTGASPYGALDMAGNVWEWVTGLYDRTYYSYAPAVNPPGPSAGTGERILRGGAWDSWPAQARTSFRNATHFFGPNLRVGFRCARDPSPECLLSSRH